MPQIVCRDVSLGYDGRLVCEHLSFELNKGEYLCIVGDNGSGKSTLMKALLGLKTPERGELVMDKRGRVGYLPQQSERETDFPATVSEVVGSGCVGGLGKRFFYGKREWQTVKESMERLGISELAERPFSVLSGGQRQRTLLARALCAAKDIILLDEPVAGLDPLATAELYALIKGLNDSGVTVIMITHDIGAAVTYAEKILHMGERPQFFASVSEYMRSEAFPENTEVRNA